MDKIDKNVLVSLNLVQLITQQSLTQEASNLVGR